MRISDWSSDVCSSDLGGRIGSQLVPHPESFGQRLDGLHVDPARPALRALRPAHVRHRVDADPLPVTAGNLEHRPHDVHFPGDRGRLDLREPGFAPVGEYVTSARRGYGKAWGGK